MKTLFSKITLLLCTLLLSVNSVWGQTYNGGTWYSLYDYPSNQTDGYKNTDKVFDVYAPTSKSCSFEWKKTGYFFGYPGCDIYISQSSNGGSSYGDENHAIASPVTKKQDSWTSASVAVDELINKIKFRQGGTLNRHFKNVTIPLAKHIRLVNGTYGTTSVTKDFGNVEWETFQSYKVNFRSFLTNGNITVSIVGDDNGDFSFSSANHAVHTLTSSDAGKPYSMGANMCASENGTYAVCGAGQLGLASNYDFTVYFYPKKGNVGASYTGNTVYVKITDGKSTAKVILRGKCVKRNQIISWDNSAATYNTTDNITYNAVANDAISGTASGGSVTYAPTSGSPAYMSGNALQIITSGTTTITASAAADTYYNAASNVTKNITINKVTPAVTWPVIASGLKYNESCAIGDKVSDHWTGGSAEDDKHNSVAGTFVCDADLLPANNVSGYLTTFNPTNTNWYNSTSTTIYGTVAKGDQTISWGLTENVEYATGTLMDATATSGLTVTYTPNSNDGHGYINENNRLVVVEPNETIVITAHQAGNDNWNPAPDVTKTIITLGANPNQYTDVHASGITYGDLLRASTLSGAVYLDEVEIAGTLSWVDPSIMPNAGTAAHMVLFTPTNTAAYSSVYFEVPVTVAKATPVITWNIGSILREEVRYDHFVTSSNKEKEFSISVSNATLLNVSGLTLRTGSVDNRVTGLTITLTQEASDNYNRKVETKTIAIYPKAGICLPFNPMDKSAYDEAMKATDGGSWCNTNDNGNEPFDSWGWGLINVTYSQRVGIKLGNWRGGFDYSTKYVDLFFSGIPDQISFDYELQTVHSPGIDWPTTSIDWYLYESADDVTYTERVHRTNNSGTITYTLDENTRYVRIVYGGNFAGFVKNLVITQKKYLREKNNKSELVFGTEANPLQQPQTLTLSYSSLGVCGGTDDNITVTSSNPAFYVDETTITENVGIELKGEYVVRVRCNDVNQSGTLTFESNDGTTLNISVRSTKPAITTAATSIFETGTEYASVSASYRALRTHDFSDCFDGAQAKFDTLYIYGVSESSAADRQWIYDASKGYKVPAVSASNVHTPCFVYYKDGAQYTYARTFDASTTTLNIANGKKCGFVGYRAEAPASNAIQVSGANAELYLDNTEIVASGAPLAVNATSAVYANGTSILSSTGNAAVQLSGTVTLSIEDTWTGAATSAILALRPATSYPSIDLGSASGRVDINGTQLELHNATHMAIAHMDGTTEKYDGEVQINDGSIGGEEILGMPKLTFIDGGTFNDGRVDAYTLKGVAKRPRNSRGEMLSRYTMSPAALAEDYSWYGQSHLTPDGAAKVNPMLMDEEVWIFTGDDGEDYNDEYSWNKDGVPGENDDVLINAPMVIDGGEMKVKSLTINWEDKGRGVPAVTIEPDGGLTVGEGGIDGIKVNMVNNLALKAGTEGATKGQTGFLRIHPNSAEPMPAATVELYSKAYYNYNDKTDNIANWQYVGSPLASTDILAKTVYTDSWIYSWNESADKWFNERKTLKFTPFVGYSTTQRSYPDGVLLEYRGQIVSNKGKHDIDLAWSGKDKGYNALANSFTAPIDITKFVDEDFYHADSVVYIFNTGSRSQAMAAAAQKSAAIDNPGQFLAIPVGSIRALKKAFEEMPTTIAPMQGFFVRALADDARVTLDYNKHVWNGDYVKNPNKPMRAPRQLNESDDEEVGALQISLFSNTGADHLFMLESEQFDSIFENGMDARKLMGDELNIFSVAGNDQLAVNATNSFEGTRIGVRTGDSTTYVMKFTHLNSEHALALMDNETNETIDINEGTEYTFYAMPNSVITGRFVIVESANAPAVTTGVDETKSSVKAHKFLKNGQLFILKNGVLYTATGAVAR